MEFNLKPNWSLRDNFNNKYLILAIVYSVLFTLAVGGIIGVCIEYSYNKKHTPYALIVQHKENILHMEQAKCNLIDEIDKYIHSIAPSSCLNGLTVVEACDEYDIDVLFVLAQGQIESHYGTRGIASKTNSVFNVHSFDGISANQIINSGKGYKHPDFSVRPYLKLLQERYLVEGKTERDMFHKFVDKNGHRYASAADYENKLLNTYTKIDSTTNINILYKEYKKYKIITYE